MGRVGACCLVALALMLAAPAGAAPQKVAVNLFEDASDLTAQLKKAIAGRVMIDELTSTRTPPRSTSRTRAARRTSTATATATASSRRPSP